LKTLYSIFTSLAPYLGVILLFGAFLTWNQLIDIDKRLFDITWNLAIILLLYRYTDAPAIAVSALLSWRIYDELTYDTGVVNWFDICVELPVILTITLVKAYIIKYGREELKGLLYPIISKIKKV
jgi:hypothetical protein